MSAAATPPSIVATGSSLPETVRTNDDPIFVELIAKSPPGENLFTGYDTRRVLAPGESIADHMVVAARAALNRAGVAASDVDLVTGYCSVGSWEMPNDLISVANQLGVAPSATIIPVNSEYANFNHGLLLADGLIASGRCTRALVVVGTNWTQHVDYLTPPAISAADGAGAAVVTASGQSGLWHVVDHLVDAAPQFYGGMYVAADPTLPARTPPTFGAQLFHFNENGKQAFQTFGMLRPPVLVAEVLERNGLTPADVAFIGHQTSAVLNDAWQKALSPQVFVQTLAMYGNMTAASIPVNLDVCAAQLTTSHVALVALGPEPSCDVVLLGRNP